VSFIREFVSRWAAKASPGQAPTNGRKMFEARFENELFLADELLSRGGAYLPEDHMWLDKLVAAYEASASAAYSSSDDIPDPWALDTQPEVFESMQEAKGTAPDQCRGSFSLTAEEDPITQARELREEAARIRKGLRPTLAALAHEREQMRRAVDGVVDVLKGLRRGK